MDELAPILAFTTRHEAELAKTFLAAHDIPAVLRTDDCGSQNPPLASLHEVTLEVRCADLDAADALLDVVDAEQTPTIDVITEIDMLKEDLWKAVRGVIAGCFLFPAALQPFALHRALQVMRRVRACPEATRGMRNQIVATVLVSSLMTLIFLFELGLLIADSYLPP